VTLPDSILIHRCPYWMVGIEAKVLTAYKDGRFVCDDCAHTVRASIPAYRCTCQNCLAWRKAKGNSQKAGL
jgi:hypothetical protein